jgi:hypothetical protein
MRESAGREPEQPQARNGRQCLAIVTAFAACILCTSCARSFRNPFSTAGPPAPDVLVPGAPLDQIIAAVNRNAQLIQNYQTHNASINIPGALGIPTLRGHIAAQRPGRVRLDASTTLTGSEVDLGSNEELFWFWVKRNEPPAVYFARHSQAVGSAAQQLMPIEPQWLVDALGMAEFRPGDQHQGPLPVGKNRVEITSIVASRSGTMTKKTVVDVAKAWVLEQHLYDASGQLLASAVAKSHSYYPETGVSLPQVIEIRIPPAELAMTIDVGTVELNRLVDNPQLWTMPPKPGAPAVDLGAAPPADPGGGVPTMGAQIGNADWYADAPQYGGGESLGSIPIAPHAQAMAAAPAPATNAGSTASMASSPAAQFVPPGGVVQPAGQSSAANQPVGLGAQRLPAGGVMTPALVR